MKTMTPYRRHDRMRSWLNDSDPDPCIGIDCYPVELTDTAFVITLVISCTGTFVNLLSIVVILGSLLRRVTNSILIVQLNLVNLMTCSIVLAIQAAEFRLRENFLGNTYCRYAAAFRFWLVGVDLLLICAIAISRWLLVVYNEFFKIVSKSTWLLNCSTICYIIPAVYVAMPLTGLWGSYRFEPRILQCTMGYSAGNYHKMFIIVLGYTLPSSIIIGCYLHIVLYVGRQGKAMGTSNKQRQIRTRRATRKLYGLTAITTLSFIAGLTPFCVVSVLDPHLEYPVAHLWASITAWSTYMLNPAVYSLMDIKFQRASSRIFNRWSSRSSFSAQSSQMFADVL